MPDLPPLIYLHGLNSSGRSRKAALLRAAFAPRPVLAPDYPAQRPAAAVAVLSAYLHRCGTGAPPVLIGSSMGGFYGQYLARVLPVAHLFMINPALDAVALWTEMIDITMTTATGEPYRLTRADVAALVPYAVAAPCAQPVPTTLFVDQGDALIDHRIASARYRDCGRVLVYPGGDHEFQHLAEAIAVIRATPLEGK